MSASQIRFGAAAVKFRSSRFGPIGKSCRLSVVRTHRGRAMMAHDAMTAHQPLDSTAAHPAALSLQLGMDAGCYSVRACRDGVSSTISRLAADRRLSERERQA